MDKPKTNSHEDTEKEIKPSVRSVLNPHNEKYGEKPDITFIFPANGGATISAEKIALSSKSDVFQKQFIAWKDSPEERIQITDISFDIFNKFIKYIYGHEIDIYEENYLEILYAAQKYFVNQLTFLAIEFLKKFIDEKNVVEHFEFIEKFDIKMLNDHMKKAIVTKPLEIIKKK
ncbi:hypothetical protein DMENIID0001_033720 [Sergentomyia squamirostris]